MSNSNWGNTATALRTLVKSNIGLKGTKTFGGGFFRKMLSGIFHRVHKKTIVESSLVKLYPAIYWKRGPSQVFSDEFWKIFQNSYSLEQWQKGAPWRNSS